MISVSKIAMLDWFTVAKMAFLMKDMEWNYHLKQYVLHGGFCSDTSTFVYPKFSSVLSKLRNPKPVIALNIIS